MSTTTTAGAMAGGQVSRAEAEPPRGQDAGGAGRRGRYARRAAHGCGGRVDQLRCVGADARVAARFTRYSANNVLLLWMQAEQRGVALSQVAGYRSWQAMGRQVVKGARSFGVLAPVRRRLSADEAAQRAAAGQRPAYDANGRPAMVVRGFRIERVFRYEDTTGEPLPEAPEFGQVTGDTPPGGWDLLADLVTGHGFTLTAESEQGDTRGHTDYTQRVANVDPGYPLAERVHVLVHELDTFAAATRPAATSPGLSGRPRPSRSRSSCAPR